jgi:hypothetical protein
MSNLYLIGVVLTVCLGVLVPWFDGKRVLSVKAKLFGNEFPDYSDLSGVPLPKPLVSFDVDKAKPRPYRPFRWNYVQNMGTSSSDTSPTSGTDKENKS